MNVEDNMMNVDVKKRTQVVNVKKELTLKTEGLSEINEENPQDNSDIESQVIIQVLWKMKLTMSLGAKN